jgi:hypothetical protein
MSTLAAAAAVAPPAVLPRIRRHGGAHNTARARGAPLHAARRGAVSVTTNALPSVPAGAGAAELAAEDDSAARPLTAVIVGGGTAGLAACVVGRCRLTVP